MALTNLSYLCSDFLLEHYPDATGGHLADLMAAALSEAESVLLGTPHALTDRDIRAHLRSFFDSNQVEPGIAESHARVCRYRDLCSEWVSDLDTGDLLSIEVALAIDVAVSNARDQMKEDRWPERGLGEERMFWLLRQAISWQKSVVRRKR